MATRFDYRHVPGYCTKEDRFESGNPSGLPTGKGIQRFFQFSNSTETLGQLTRRAAVQFDKIDRLQTVAALFASGSIPRSGTRINLKLA